MKRLAPALLLCAVSLWPQRAGAAAPFVPDDPLPAGALLRLGLARLRHPARVECLAFSPDSRTLATAGLDRGVRLWDVRDGRRLLQLPDAGNAVVFSPDGRSLATADQWGRGDAVRLFDAKSGKLLRTFGELTGRCVAFSPDGKAVAGADEQHRVVLCEAATGRVVRRLEGLKNPARSVAFSRDGKALAAGDETGGALTTSTAVVWDVATGKERCRMTDDEGGWTHAVSFSPDGRWLATATPYHVRLWDARTGKRTADLGGRANNDAAFDGSGRLVTGGDVTVWEVEKGKPASPSRRGCPAVKLAVSADGKLIATAAYQSHRARLWDAGTGAEVLAWPGHLDDVCGTAWSPDGRRVLTACPSDGTVRLWDAATGAPVWRRRLLGEHDVFSRGCGPEELSFSPDGRTVVTPGRLLLASTGEPAGPLADGRAVAYSPGGSLAAVVERRRGLQIQGGTGRVLHRLRLSDSDGDDNCKYAAFSPDGRTLAVAFFGRRVSGDRERQDSVQLWDVATGQRVRTLRPSYDAPERIAFSPDGSLLLCSRVRGRLQLVDARTGREVCRLAGHDDYDRYWGDPIPVAFSPDGALLATAGKGGSVVVWEAASGGAVRVLPGHEKRTLSLAFSPDGTRLLSGGSDATALVWRVLPSVRREPQGKDAAERLWAALAGDASGAYRAVASLLDWPDAVGLFGKKLRPDADPDPSRVERLIADLTDEEFGVRQKAEDALRALGASAEPALRRASQNGSDLEQRRRLQRLLGRLEVPPSADELRDRRAILALERIGTPAAEAVLEKLARGGEWGRKTLAAAAALERLESARRRARPAAIPARPKPDGSPPRRLGGHKGEVHAVAFTPDGRTAYTAGGDGKIRRWDVSGSKELAALGGHEGGTFALAVSGDGKRLASAGDDGKVRLWDLPAGKLALTLAGHEHGSWCVAFRPDGKTLASGGMDGHVRLWATQDGKAAGAIPLGGRPIGAVAFAADGARVLAAASDRGVLPLRHWFRPFDANVRLWSVKDGRATELPRQDGHAVRLSAGGRLAAATAYAQLTDRASRGVPHLR